MNPTPRRWPRGEVRTLAQSRRLCRSIAKSHYENFLVATVFLPAEMRQPFHDVYAFCRTADDIADESASSGDALAGLDHYERTLDRIERGLPVTGIFVALADTVSAYGLSLAPFRDLLIAFRQDQTKTRYRSRAELLDYCRYSANPVGRIVLSLADCSQDRQFAWSDQVCTGLQLANFWQDVSRDIDKGRVYLPADAMRGHGVDESMLSGQTTPAPLRSLLREECEFAETQLRQGLSLADHVPNWLSKDVRLFVHGGLAVLAAIRDIDFDVLAQRPTVSKRRQLALLWKAWRGQLTAGTASSLE